MVAQGECHEVLECLGWDSPMVEGELPQGRPVRNRHCDRIAHGRAAPQDQQATRRSASGTTQGYDRPVSRSHHSSRLRRGGQISDERDRRARDRSRRSSRAEPFGGRAIVRSRNAGRRRRRQNGIDPPPLVALAARMYCEAKSRSRISHGTAHAASWLVEQTTDSVLRTGPTKDSRFRCAHSSEPFASAKRSRAVDQPRSFLCCRLTGRSGDVRSLNLITGQAARPPLRAHVSFRRRQ
jgi:hypothetical protein